MNHGDWKEMFRAVETNDADLLEYYIKQGIDLNYQHPEYLTSALIESIRLHHINISKILLDSGAIPDLPEVYSKKSPLQIAKDVKNFQAMNLINDVLGLKENNNGVNVGENEYQMKAIVCTKYGGPEVLQVRSVPKPSPKEDEVLIKIISTAVNSGDVRVRGLEVEGLMKIVMRFVLGFNKPRKPILGTVYSGVIVDSGKKVTKFKTGDKVFGMTGFKFGTYAEFLVTKENGEISIMPINATFDEAAALIFGGQSAIYFLEKAKILEKKKPKVLIIGATGSVGIAATQLAQFYDGDITAVCSSSGQQLIRDLGISKIVLYDKEDFTKIDTKFDIIFDAVGKANKKHCKKMLKNDGVFKTVSGLEVATESVKQLELIKTLFEKGKLKTVFDKTYSFEEIVEAHRYVETGRKKGNVVLKIDTKN